MDAPYAGSRSPICYAARLETLPAKEYLVIKGTVLLGGDDAPDAYAQQERMLSERTGDGSVERLQRAAGSTAVYTLFCHTCRKDEATGGYVCGSDIACENVRGAQAGDGFDVVRLEPSAYAVFDCIFPREMTKAQASRVIDDMFWGEWLSRNDYESLIEVETGADTLGIACIGLNEPLASGAGDYRVKVWFPVMRAVKKPHVF